MTEGVSSSHPQLKRVPIRDRAFSVGDLICINGYNANRNLLKQRFAEGDYNFQETPHFMLCARTAAPTTVLIHWLSPEEIDADIGKKFMRELKPLGLISDAQHFGQVFAAVVFSLYPYNPQQALHLYADNTMRRYRNLIESERIVSPLSDSTIHDFAEVYRKVIHLRTGESFLDAGCSFGFLPLLIAERFPSLTRVVGIDIETDPFPIMRAIAEEQQLNHVRFIQADLLADDFASLGIFDTVTAIHILEHFHESDMYRVLTNLLRITSQRLILAVPYESDEPEIAYGHEQLFSRSKLDAVGTWCLRQLKGRGKISYEECAGGLLLIERPSSWARVNRALFFPS
jgi:2-polyprenyl-3-methyl-5-hydroxy-6-metoxy-1,4-benzoquinol methylase